MVVSEPMCNTKIAIANTGHVSKCTWKGYQNRSGISYAFAYPNIPTIMFQIRSKEPSDADQFDVGG